MKRVGRFLSFFLRAWGAVCALWLGRCLLLIRWLRRSHHPLWLWLLLLLHLHLVLAHHLLLLLWEVGRSLLLLLWVHLLLAKVLLCELLLLLRRSCHHR